MTTATRMRVFVQSQIVAYLKEHARGHENAVPRELISGYDCPLYRRLYEGWQISSRKALADGARARKEMLWLSPNIQQGMLIPEESRP